MEAEAFLSSHRTGPVALNASVVALMATAALGRRRHPVAFLIVVDGLSLLLTGGLTSLHYATVTGSYALVLPLWTVATCTTRRTATFGLILYTAGGTTTMALIDQHHLVGLFGPLVAGAVVWGAGRVLQAHRRATVELQRRTHRLRQRRQERMRIAAATESTRLARELQTGIAQALAVIVVETEAAQLLVAAGDPEGVEAIGQIEEAARRTLADMRRTLGVLRRAAGDDDAHARRTPGPLQPRLESRPAADWPSHPVAALR